MELCCKNYPTRTTPNGVRYKSLWWDNDVGTAQYAMWNKAEVLKHKNNRANLTRKQRYSRLVQFGKIYAVHSVSQRAELKMECASKTPIISFPSYYSNVPGNKVLYSDSLQPSRSLRPVRRYATPTQKLLYRRAKCEEALGP